MFVQNKKGYVYLSRTKMYWLFLINILSTIENNALRRRGNNQIIEKIAFALVETEPPVHGFSHNLPYSSVQWYDSPAPFSKYHNHVAFNHRQIPSVYVDYLRTYVPENMPQWHLHNSSADHCLCPITTAWTVRLTEASHSETTSGMQRGHRDESRP
jgi:hypothetical protein